MQINKKFLLKKVGSEHMLIPLHEEGLDMSKVFNLNEVGYFIYNLLDKENNLEEIKVAIIKEYEIDGQTAETDLMEFIAALKQRGILYD